MKKSIFFRLSDEEFELIESYCLQNGRTKSDVLRELIRKLKPNKKPATEEGACVPLFLVTAIFLRRKIFWCTLAA